MTNDLFIAQPKTQCEKVYEFIKSRGRVLSHELNEFALNNYIGCPGSRVRELKAQGKVWHIRPAVMACVYPKSKEIGWSIYESDREYEKPI